MHLASSALMLPKELKLLVVSLVIIIVPKMNLCLYFPLLRVVSPGPHIWLNLSGCIVVRLCLFNDHLLTIVVANLDPEVKSS